MRRTCLFLVIFCTGIAASALGQTLPEESVDDFTKRILTVTAEWVLVSTDPSMITFVHKVRWERIGLNKFALWRQELVRQTGRDTFNRAVGKTEISCDDHRVRALSYAFYADNKLMMTAATPTAEWKESIPESVGDTALVAICKYLELQEKKEAAHP